MPQSQRQHGSDLGLIVRDEHARFLSLGKAANAFEEMIEIHRFLQELGDAQVRRCPGQVGARGQHEDGNRCQIGVTQLFLTKLPAVHDRHQEVQDDEVDRRAGAQKGQCLLAVGRGHREAVRRFHGHDQPFADHGVILDHQDRLARRRSCLLHKPSQRAGRHGQARRLTA